MKRTVTAVIAAADVALILAHHILEARGIETVPGSAMQAELMACAVKDAAGKVGIEQYRIEAIVEEVAEDWRGKTEPPPR